MFAFLCVCKQPVPSRCLQGKVTSTRVCENKEGKFCQAGSWSEKKKKHRRPTQEPHTTPTLPSAARFFSPSPRRRAPPLSATGFSNRLLRQAWKSHDPGPMPCPWPQSHPLRTLLRLRRYLLGPAELRRGVALDGQSFPLVVGTAYICDLMETHTHAVHSLIGSLCLAGSPPASP